MDKAVRRPGGQAASVEQAAWPVGQAVRPARADGTSAALAASLGGWPADRLTARDQFPIFTAHPGLVYLDSAATAQKPRAVIQRLERYYSTENANVHRGVYGLSAEATARYDEARAAVARFLGATSPNEIVFTRGTTESLNLVANSWGSFLRSGDEILVSGMEHHSNIVPWQLLAERSGALIRVIPITDEGELDLAAYGALLNDRTRIVAVTHLSNVLGTINPVRRIADLAHDAGAVVVVDGAQSAAHLTVNLAELGCDFFAASGHKLFGPMGIGVLWGREKLLEHMPPWQGGGGMIGSVTFERTTFAPLPQKFEAGTPHVAGAVGLHAAIDWAAHVGMHAIESHEDALLARATERLRAIPGVRIYGESCSKAAVIAFTVDGAHPHDVGTVLDGDGVCIRAGHHCCAPLMQRFGVAAMARASFGPYNGETDVDALARGLERVRELFA